MPILDKLLFRMTFKKDIKEVQFTFGGHSFFLDTISIGKIQSDIIERKLFYDYMTAPPFGMTPIHYYQFVKIHETNQNISLR